MAAILIALPQPAERDALAQALTGAGHAVTACADDDDAFDKWQKNRHELVVADERLPRKTGAELAARIRAESSQSFTPILIVSDRADADARAQLLASCEDVLVRPLATAELLARVEAQLRVRRLVDQLRAARAESEARAIDDPTTGLRNRAFLLERLHEEWKRAARYNEPLSLILVSVEGVREQVRARTPDFGDRVMTHLAQAAQSSLRQIDVIARHGTHELAALLPNTHFAGSMVCAERLLRAVRASAVDGWPVQVVMGIAFYPSRDLAEPADLLKLATRALERARSDGAGAICLFQQQGYLFRPE